MNFSQLKIFLDIANEKSFVKAAQLNFLTQPAISSQIKRLEEELGVKLFERTPRRVNLTTVGAKLVPEAEEILRRAQTFKHIAGNKREAVFGEIRIATIFSIGIYELSPFLKKFIKKHPQVHVNLQYRRSFVIYDLLLKNKIDMGFVAYPKERTGIQIIPFGNDHMVLITPSKHPLLKQKSVRLKMLEGHTFLSFDDGIPTGEEIKKIFMEKNINIQKKITYENIDTLKKAVEVGLGIALVPHKTVTEEIQKGKLRSLEIKDIKMGRPLGILVQDRQVINPLIKHFLKVLLP